MGFITDLLTGGWETAYWNQECKNIHMRLGIPIASPYYVSKVDEDDIDEEIRGGSLSTEDKIIGQESDNLSVYAKVHWDEKIE